MAKVGRRDLPKGITPKLRAQGTGRVPVTTPDGTPVYRVRLWDPVLKRQIERTAEGLDAAKKLLGEFNEAKRRPAGSRPSVCGSPTWRPGICCPTGTARRDSPSEVVAGQGADLPERLHPPGARQRLDRRPGPARAERDHPAPDAARRQPGLGKYEEHGRVRAAAAVRLGAGGADHPGHPRAHGSRDGSD